MNTRLPAKKAPIAKAPVAVKKIITPALAKVKPEKNLKFIKPKLIRDSFTIPKDEYQMLTDLKIRMTTLVQPAKKSELLRAGLKALTAMSDAAIKKALLAVPSIKTGRPAKSIKK